MSAGEALGPDELAYNTTVSLQATLADEAETARSAGFRAIETLGRKVDDCLAAGLSRDEVRSHLDGLTVVGIGPLLDIERQGGACHDMFREAERLFETARTVGARGIQIVTGPVDVRAVDDHRLCVDRGRYAGLLGCDIADVISLTAKNVRGLADRVAGEGMVLYVEALCWGPLRTLDQQMRLLDSVDRDNVKIVVDFWHCHTAGDMPDDLAKIDGQRIYGVHVCDALPHAGGIPDESVLRDVPTGDGVLDLEAWVEAVKATGYDGWWSSETFCKRQRQQNSLAVAKALHAQLGTLVSRERSDARS